MTIKDFIDRLTNSAEGIEFSETMAVIDANYEFNETAFDNGDQHNAAGTNSGSCKVFAFAQLNQLTEQQTLSCFGAYYRDDVLKHPQNDDHQNIRNFIKHGWAGIKFANQAKPLAAK